MTPSASAEYTVNGMSCQHCVAAVTSEVARVAGVTAVEVDLERKRVTVHGEDVDEAAVRDAIDEAGYEVAA